MHDSDSDKQTLKIKEEVINEDEPIKKKSNNKSPEKKSEHPENLTLTADKMMKKELNLLHAPDNIHDELAESIGKGRVTRNSKKVSEK